MLFHSLLSLNEKFSPNKEFFFTKCDFMNKLLYYSLHAAPADSVV